MTPNLDGADIHANNDSKVEEGDNVEAGTVIMSCGPITVDDLPKSSVKHPEINTENHTEPACVGGSRIGTNRIIG